eukprot:UN3420
MHPAEHKIEVWGSSPCIGNAQHMEGCVVGHIDLVKDERHPYQVGDGQLCQEGLGPERANVERVSPERLGVWRIGEGKCYGPG